MIKKSIYLICLLLPFLCFSQSSPRSNDLFDFEWKFILGDSVKAPDPDYNDIKWEQVQFPHDWSIHRPRNINNGAAMGFFPGGIGWYRKVFSVPANFKAKKVTIHFDGVYHQSTVYLNGKKLGFHPYGYTSFEYDLTPYLNNTGNNVIAVRVDHSNSPTSRWYSGSGIYRHVWLRATEPVHVATWGTYITTLRVEKELADVLIKTTIANPSTVKGTIEVENTILSSEGKAITSAKATVGAAREEKSITQQSLQVHRPTLWSLQTPYLYTMVTKVTVNGRLSDRYQTTFGIRDLKFDANLGFFLNGVNTKLKGVCLHQDAGILGTAVPDQSYLRRLKILKEYGCNAIRCSHNPPTSEFLDMCDSLGFVVIDEAFDKWKSGYYANYFDEWWQKDMDAMLLRDRNHPSIILWSIGNETREQNDTTGEGTARATKLRDYVRSVDPTRLVAAALEPAALAKRLFNRNGFADVLDVVGYNYQEPWLQADKEAFPNRIMFISEAFPYYRGRPGSHRDYSPINPWFDVAKNDFVFGQFLWAGVDYLGESTEWPSSGWPTGLFDECMFEKPRGAFHRSVWNTKPMVSIVVVDQSLDIDPGKDHWGSPNLAAHWTFPQYEGHVIEVETVSNCDTVELWVNEKSMGRRKTSDYPNNTIEWHVPYKKGKIYTKAYNAGKEMAQFELNTAGSPAKVVLSADRQKIFADGQDVSHITIQLVDEKGVIVPNADEMLTVELLGNGRLLGLDNGDLRTVNTYGRNMIKTYNGKALAIVQSARTKGDIEIKVSSKSLQIASLLMKADK